MRTRGLCTLPSMPAGPRATGSWPESKNHPASPNATGCGGGSSWTTTAAQRPLGGLPLLGAGLAQGPPRLWSGRRAGVALRTGLHLLRTCWSSGALGSAGSRLGLGGAFPERPSGDLCFLSCAEGPTSGPAPGSGPAAVRGLPRFEACREWGLVGPGLGLLLLLLTLRAEVQSQF